MSPVSDFQSTWASTPGTSTFDDPPLYSSTQSDLEWCIAISNTSFLRRCLTGIMAVTFDADIITALRAAIQELNVALGSREDPTPLERSSILSIREKTGLKELCALIKNMEKKYRCNEWNTTLERDRNLVVRAVLEPAYDLGIQADYTLAVIGRYTDVKSRGVGRKGTLGDYWTPWCARFRPRPARAMRELGDTLRSYFFVIASVLPAEENIRIVLGNAMANFQRRRGIRKLKHTGQTLCWPLSDGYMDLYEMLKTPTMHPDGSWMRDSLREQRKRRS